MKCAIVQPPFVQLNTAYPAAWYLESRLATLGHEAAAHDHSIETFRSIFSRTGLIRVFRDAAIAWKDKSAKADSATRSQVERYFSSRQLYIDWIDDIMAFLSGSDPGFAHRLTTAAERPVGFRTETWLESVAGRPAPDEAPILATRILEDIADFISFTLDPDFGTVRYADRLASGIADFGALEKRLESSYIMEEFYRPLVRTFLDSRTDTDIFLVTIPFPGCLAGALTLAREIRNSHSAIPGLASAPILFGGGYVSTELRNLADPRIFDYCDYLCFDSGYEALSSILARHEANLQAPPQTGIRTSPRTTPPVDDQTAFRQLMYRDDSGSIVRCHIDDAACAKTACGDSARIVHTANLASAIAGTFPDYSRLDFSRYLRIVDSANPMHRLWSDTPWLKFHLAHGCYWHRCSFCDTTLDYVANYVPSDVDALVAACAASAEATGLYGIHFVDEALPVGRLLAFAEANRKRRIDGKRPFHFWGNVRFDASWTAERCELLAASGLVAVSGGIEIASESGLAMTDKGFDLAGLVQCLLGMKSSGLLVHAYLIYGFPAQTGFQIVESAETVRQLFASGLVDSAFWHRFVLTRHSRMYADWKSGQIPPRKGACEGMPDRSFVPEDAPRPFADNDLSFAGSARFDSYDSPVATSLAAWMEGESLVRPVWEWFPDFPKKDRNRLPRPDLIESLIEKAQSNLESTLSAAPSPATRAFWTAGLPVVHSPDSKASGKNTSGPTDAGLAWTRRGAMAYAAMPSISARRASEAIAKLASLPEGMKASDFVTTALPGSDIRFLDLLRGDGLVFI